MEPRTGPVVLVVEDDDATRRLIATALADHAMVVSAIDAAQALRTILAIRPDVVILDLMLPDASGASVAATIHERAKRQPRVIVVSASPDAAATAAAIHADAFLPKPFDIEVLVATVLALVVA